MNDQILKLCRRLKHCTLDDIIQFTEKTEDEIMPVIYYLLDNNILKENKGVYSVNTYDLEQKRVNLAHRLQYYSDSDFEIIVKSFCLNIPSTQIKYFVKCSENSISSLYRDFRETLYNCQLKELSTSYSQNPKVSRTRHFFKRNAYFYCYNQKLYVVEKPIQGKQEKSFSKAEVIELKKVYSYLKRIESHNRNENYLYHRLAERIWRRNKSFEELYNELKNLIKENF